MAERERAAETLLRQLPATFTYAQAVGAGVPERTFYRLRDTGLITPVGRGLFRRTDDAPAADIDLIEIANRAPRATLCLTTALAHHDLTDEIPATIDVALPRGRYRPTVMAPVTWHLFDPATFEVGRTELQLEAQTAIGLYGPERTIIDAFRLRHREGLELGYTALKRWLRRSGSTPADLLRMARQFPQAQRKLRETLEVLL